MGGVDRLECVVDGHDLGDGDSGDGSEIKVESRVKAKVRLNV